ncbi:MAG: enolase C-terminal domain-like protein [Acetobacteraceae bacterium]
MKIWPFDIAAEASGGRFISAADMDRALLPFRKIRDAVGGRWTSWRNCIRYGTCPPPSACCAPCGIPALLAEDPIKMTNADLLAGLRARTTVPICASETLATRHAFREYLQRDAVDVVMLDLSWCGGIGEAKKIATLAESWDGPLHRMTAPARSC